MPDTSDGIDAESAYLFGFYDALYRFPDIQDEMDMVERGDELRDAQQQAVSGEWSFEDLPDLE